MTHDSFMVKSILRLKVFKIGYLIYVLKNNFKNNFKIFIFMLDGLNYTIQKILIVELVDIQKTFLIFT